jgi:two-component system chemotaxis sensor kinase CheA
VPTLSIVRSFKPEAKNIATVAECGELFILQNDMLPLFRLYRLFDIEGAEKDPLNGIVVILESESKRVGLLVDELLGQQQIVIKSLGNAMTNLDGIAGAAIMPDGQVGLIIDVSGIFRLVDGDGSSYDAPATAA